MLSLRKKTRFVQHWHILAHLNACYHDYRISIPDNFSQIFILNDSVCWVREPVFVGFSTQEPALISGTLYGTYKAT